VDRDFNVILEVIVMGRAGRLAGDGSAERDSNEQQNRGDRASRFRLKPTS